MNKIVYIIISGTSLYISIHAQEALIVNKSPLQLYLNGSLGGKPVSGTIGVRQRKQLLYQSKPASDKVIIYGKPTLGVLTYDHNTLPLEIRNPQGIYTVHAGLHTQGSPLTIEHKPTV
jgi:hypothetical protein